MKKIIKDAMKISFCIFLSILIISIGATLMRCAMNISSNMVEIIYHEVEQETLQYFLVMFVSGAVLAINISNMLLIIYFVYKIVNKVFDEHQDAKSESTEPEETK